MAQDVIAIENLTKCYKDKEVLKGVTLSVGENSIFGYLGPNGAGKTTTIRVLLGLIQPSTGKVEIMGESPTSTELRLRIGAVLEDDGLYDRLSALDNLLFFASIYQLPSKSSSMINELLDDLGLYERRHEKVGTFSKGMRKKLAMVRALIHDPSIVFLDEPTANLDTETQYTIRGYIKNLVKTRGKTIFFTSHNLVEVEKLCSHIAILKDGRIVIANSLDNFTHGLNAFAVEINLKSGVNQYLINDLRNLDYVTDVDVQDKNLIVFLSEDKVSKLIQHLLDRGVAIGEVKKKTRSLEEAYLSVIKGGITIA